MKKCILEDKKCTDCGICDQLCQLDPNKVCNNCFQCLGLEDFEEQSYAQIPISAVYLQDEIILRPVSRENVVHISTLNGFRGHYKRRDM